MKIVSLRVENFQRIKAIEIRPEGDVIRLTGKNEAGKSSVLDAIWTALGGKAHEPKMPIRKGETEAGIDIDLGDLMVTKRFKKRDDDTVLPMLVVKNKEGFKASNPQETLNRLFGMLTFDPLAFSRAKPAEQLAILRGLVPDFDFAANDALIKEAKEKRTDANRDAKRLWAQVEGIAVDADAPTELIPEDELVSELERVMELNAAAEREEIARKGILGQVKRERDTAAGQMADAAELRRRADEMEADAKRRLEDADIAEKEVWGRKAVEILDVGAIREKITEARATNEVRGANLRARRQRADLKSQAEAADELSASLTEKIRAAQAAAETAIRAAKLPVEGLSFGDDYVMLNDVPFEQASSSRKIDTSVRIASALNPGLRVIQVRDGSLLDSDAKALIAKFAAENDMQFWIEEVDETGQVGIVIEDGMVKAREEA